MQPAQPSGIEMFLPFIFIFVIFYFLIIRPQSKRAKTHEKFLGEVKRGDAVITSGGILGTVDGMTEQFLTLEIADGVKIRILRKQIAGTQAGVLEQNKKTESKGS